MAQSLSLSIAPSLRDSIFSASESNPEFSISAKNSAVSNNSSSRFKLCNARSSDIKFQSIALVSSRKFPLGSSNLKKCDPCYNALTCKSVQEGRELESVSDDEKIEIETLASGESFGEVEKITGSRVEDRTTQYLVRWKDGHPDSWVPSENISFDLIAEFEDAWWQVVRKADIDRIQAFLEQGRDVNAIDVNGRTAMHFAAGLGSEKCIRLLAQAGGDLQWQDNDGYTPIHIAAGYVHSTVVKALIELGADLELKDKQGRTVLELSEQLLEKLPRNNPMQFARRLALDQVVKMLDEAMFEEVEVEQILDKRMVEGVPEYLVRWSDGSEDSWELGGNIGDDLLQDFEKGLEYAIPEKILEKRETKDGVEYLVKWVDSDLDTWEPELNLAPEVIADFEGIKVELVEKRLEKLSIKA